MVQTAHTAWQAADDEQSGQASPTTASAWMNAVLARDASRSGTPPRAAFAAPLKAAPLKAASLEPDRRLQDQQGQQDINTRAQDRAHPVPDLQTRLAAIAQSIKTLESRVSGRPVSERPASASGRSPSPDPLAALRRRKEELEASTPRMAPPSAAGQMSARNPDHLARDGFGAADRPTSFHGAHQDAAGTPLDRLAAKLDTQLTRLTDAVSEVREMAERGAQRDDPPPPCEHRRHEPAAPQPMQPPQPTPPTERSPAPYGGQAPLPASAATADLHRLSRQVEAVQGALSRMPTAEAIESLEAGYKHVLTRLDALKTDSGTAASMDTLYREVTRLREVLDGLSDTGASALVREVRGMIDGLSDRTEAGARRMDEALDDVRRLAGQVKEGDDPAAMRDTFGAVVERLVALEARIEALAQRESTGAVTGAQLDALQTHMEQLSTFQDEARGLTAALDTIRQEVRTSAPQVDWSGLDQRFAALDRLEEMTGDYARQIAALGDRLASLDASLGGNGAMARDLAALSRDVANLRTDLPIHEIEQSLLDLTGRITALQEDTSAKRLGTAVYELGERVEACLRAVPSSEAMVAAMERSLDSRLSLAVSPIMDRIDGVVDRLDGVHAAICDADAPLIDHLAGRLETLIDAMPSAAPDDALAQLESRLERLAGTGLEAVALSPEAVDGLRADLARVSASVALGSNGDAQREIVDQVRHLADRFDHVRRSGDAALLPDLDREIDALASRVQALGLFGDQMDAASPTPPSAWLDALEERLDRAGSDEELKTVHTELAALRESASDKDARIHATLEAMQKAMETVVYRMSALESGALEGGERRAEEPAANMPPGPAISPAPPATPDQASLSPRQSTDDALQAAEAPSASALARAPSGTEKAERDAPPAAGDAQTLLRQLSGAIKGERPAVPPGSETAAKPYVPPTTTAPSTNTQTPTVPSEPPVDAASQRASFIAAARRAAQTAALQAGGGKLDKGSANPFGGPESDASSRADAFARDLGAQLDRVEPRLGEPALGADDDASGETDTVSSKTWRAKRKAKRDKRGSADLSADAQAEAAGEAPIDAQQDTKRSVIAGRATPLKLVGLVALTLGFGLTLLTFLLPGDPQEGTLIAPIEPAAPVQEEPTAQRNDDVAPPSEEVALAGEPLVVPQMAATDTGDAPAQDVAAAERIDDRAEALAPAPVQSGVADESDTASALASSFAPAAQSRAQSSLADDAPLADQPLGGGFERDRGPVLAETPALTAPERRPPPANDLGPLLNPAVPPLPPATSDALPEAIGAPRLRVAAATGDPAAAFEVASRFMEGRFVSQDLAAAAHWYGRAADAGIVPAAYRLGSFYEQGQGVDRDRDGAIAWYERAALAGNPRAMHNLAVMAAEGAGGTPDFSRAAAWFIPAANRGLADSQFNLAVLYARGMGLERDLMESYKWFALAADNGDVEAVSRRDEVAGVLGEQALALARARVDSWAPIPVVPSAVEVEGPQGGWDDGSVTASAASADALSQATLSRGQVAEAQRLLAERGYDPGPADGLLGPRTNEAVRAFRQSVGLAGGGIDQAVLDALRAGRTL